MKLALVILNWNGKNLLEKFIPSIVTFSKIKNVEIFVADNASTDDSISFLKINFPQVKIVKNSKNGGYAKGYNDALQHINADLYGLINSDIEVTENWLEPILEIFSKNPEATIVQPKILDYKNKSKFEYAGAAGGFIDKFGYPFCRGRIFNSLETDENQYNDIQKIFWASGACFFIKSSVFFELGGFDEDYFAHQEEIDLCWRANNLGYKVYYVGTSKVYHVGGATLKEAKPHKTFLNFRNSLFTLLKNAPRKSVSYLILVRLILDGVAGIKFLVELRGLHTFAIVRAHFSFYFYFLKIISKRFSKNKKPNYYHTKSIVWDYYIKRKEVFKDL